MSSSPKNSIRYSQCWEDSELVLKALNIQPSDVIFSIASGGENVFALLSKTNNNVHVIDYNQLQIYVTKLKLIALQNLEFEEYLEFIGLKKCKNRVEIFSKLSVLIADDCKNYFVENIDLIKKGIIIGGKFDKYLRIFKKTILPLFVSNRKLKKAVNSDDKNFRHKTYQKLWNNWRWRMLGEVFFGKSVMQKMGRHKVMFQYNEKPKTGKIYLDRAEEFIKNGAIHENPYFDFILTGKYSKNLHFYLKSDIYNSLKQKNNIKFYNSDVLSFFKTLPDNSIHKFNLSDVFEAMNETETEMVFNEIIRVSTNNARIIFWNNLVLRDVPDNLKTNFVRDFELEKNLTPTEKVFFYERFYIYEIIANN